MEGVEILAVRHHEFFGQGLAPAVLRVAIYDTGWHITNSVTVDSTKGQTMLPFPNPKSTGVISVKRMDAGEVVVGYEVS